MSFRLLLAIGVLLGGLSASTGAPRNAVLLIGDDHGLELGCYGHPVIKTPSLDRLAAGGTRFVNGFATVASCSASRSVLMTGMFNHSTSHFGHAHGVHNFHTRDDIPSLPMLLRKAGYRTGLIGKYHLKPESVYPFELFPCNGRNVQPMAESARKFIEADADKPFFLVLGYTDPHRAQEGFANKGNYPGVTRTAYRPEEVVVPNWLPDQPEVRAELAEFYESISRLDQGVGMLLDVIADTGRADDTLVIYVSDNGPPWPGAKTTLYEPGIHLPVIVSSPQQTKRGLANQAMVSYVDIAPTILAWAGVSVPDSMAGRSVLSILDEENPAGWDTVFGSHVFHEITMYYPMRMIRTRQYKYILNLAHQLDYPFASDLWASPTWQGVLRRGDRDYGKRTVDAYIHRPREELYDLIRDPDEVKNLADDPACASVLGDLRRRLREWQEQTNDPWIVKYTYE